MASVSHFPNRNLGSVEAFFGVHYASVKDGELRFMPSTFPMEKWEGIRFASRFRPVCPQKIPDLQELEQKVPLARMKYFERLIPFLEFQTEECLNLNIYLPVRGWWNISNAWNLNIAVFVTLSCHLTLDQISRQSSHWNNLKAHQTLTNLSDNYLQQSLYTCKQRFSNV